MPTSYLGKSWGRVTESTPKKVPDPASYFVTEYLLPLRWPWKVVPVRRMLGSWRRSILARNTSNGNHIHMKSVAKLNVYRNVYRNS